MTLLAPPATMSMKWLQTLTACTAVTALMGAFRVWRVRCSRRRFASLDIFRIYRTSHAHTITAR
jgi:hypothetical protein